MMNPVSLNEQQVLFKIDTGTDITAIPEASPARYDKAQDGPLQKLNTENHITKPSGQNLIVKRLIMNHKWKKRFT